MNKETLKCPLPANEEQRLQAVRSYDILDTLPEVDFDTLTRVAAHALNTPAAVIGLMDTNRLWFKSQIGLGVPQLDRQIAFCAHAIMQPGELFVVEDLRLDPRFKDNPLVTQPPNVCFYAGAPLIDRQGYALGTIAVVDVKPRVLNESQRVILRDMSAMVIAALESRQRSRLLSHMAMTDHLTGLANRAQFERTLHSEIAHATRTGEAFTVFFMDLDDFKGVNDTYGHAAGDEVLAEVALRMAEQVRAEDLLARLGGDEFGIFMRPSAEDPAESLVKRIVEAIKAPIVLSSGAMINIGISIGTAVYSEETNSVATLLAKADKALYEAKRKK
jgi:diguanylate cyclase (GGDEF)-like protein